MSPAQNRNPNHRPIQVYLDDRDINAFETKVMGDSDLSRTAWLAASIRVLANLPEQSEVLQEVSRTAAEINLERRAR